PDDAAPALPVPAAAPHTIPSLLVWYLVLVLALRVQVEERKGDESESPPVAVVANAPSSRARGENGGRHRAADRDVDIDTTITKHPTMKATTSASSCATALLLLGLGAPAFLPAAVVAAPRPYGYQSGFSDEASNDDSYLGSMHYDAERGLIYLAGSTYGTYFDDAAGSDGGGGGGDGVHSETSDCFLGVLKLPPSSGGGGRSPWLVDLGVHLGGDSSRPSDPDPDPDPSGGGPSLVFARRFGTPRNAEACSAVLPLPGASDALIRGEGQAKVALLGHVVPTPLSSADSAAMGPPGRRERRLTSRPRAPDDVDAGEGPRPEPDGRKLEYEGNRGGFLHSLSTSPPVARPGRAYGFVADFDLSLGLDGDEESGDAFGALLGGRVLDDSPASYPVAIARNGRDANQLYVASMHSDDEAEVVNPEYPRAGHAAGEGRAGMWSDRADVTLGGAGTSKSKLVGGAPPYGKDFYVKIDQLSIVPYERLRDVDPTADEGVKTTLERGWGFGFKLDDADDVRPSAMAFVKGRTPDDDLLLVGGTARKRRTDGTAELDGFVTKVVPPAPSPVPDETTGHDVVEAVEAEASGRHPTKRIDSTSDRDETATGICLPPPDPREGTVTHAYVVGSSSEDDGPAQAYVAKLRLDDLSTEWKERVPGVHPPGTSGGDVLGEGCAVAPDGRTVYLAGTIDGGASLNPGVPDGVYEPRGGKTDVFVVAYDAEFGNVRWARQLGTVRDDKLARGGGVTCDDDGDVIVAGSTRGAMQRSRSDGDDEGDETGATILASDVFVMTLSREDGSYVGAPYVGGPRGEAVSVAATAGATSSGGGLSGGATAGISLAAIGLLSAVVLFAVRRRGRMHRRDGVDETWEVTDAGDDFSLGSGLGGRRGSSMAPRAAPRGSLHVARGSGADDIVDDWDEGGLAGVGKGPAWLSGGGGGGGGGGGADDDCSVGSGRSRGSHNSAKTEENLDFLDALRREASATMRKMVRDPTTAAVASEEEGGEEQTEDPRVDGGASIKSLLTHYREVKKGGLLDDAGATTAGGGEGGEGGGGKSPGRSSRRKNPPPPPPPRRKKKEDPDEDDVGGRGDGLSEFTII
ncbi:hypothetical protein ACHAWF_013024, partial [Thalassiosira exigua]